MGVLKNFKADMTQAINELTGGNNMREKRIADVLWNVLCEILRTADFEDEEQYNCWLRTEIGMTDEEIQQFKTEGIVPDYY